MNKLIEDTLHVCQTIQDTVLDLSEINITSSDLNDMIFIKPDFEIVLNTINEWINYNKTVSESVSSSPSTVISDLSYLTDDIMSEVFKYVADNYDGWLLNDVIIECHNKLLPNVNMRTIGGNIRKYSRKPISDEYYNIENNKIVKINKVIDDDIVEAVEEEEVIEEEDVNNYNIQRETHIAKYNANIPAIDEMVNKSMWNKYTIDIDEDFKQTIYEDLYTMNYVNDIETYISTYGDIITSEIIERIIKIHIGIIYGTHKIPPELDPFVKAMIISSSVKSLGKNRNKNAVRKYILWKWGLRFNDTEINNVLNKKSPYVKYISKFF